MHTLFSVTVDAYEDSPSGGYVRRSSKLLFAKLAGSEELSCTQLSALLGVVLKLSRTDKREPKQVPYRSSSLTRLLQESLGGKAKTAWLATCAPADEEAIRNLWTVQLAECAREVLNRPTVESTPLESLPAGLGAERWPPA